MIMVIKVIHGIYFLLCIYKMRTKKKILSVLKSDSCKKKDKKCAKAIKNKLSHHKKKHHHHKTTITNKIYINNPKNNEEKEIPKSTPNPPPTAQGIRAEIPYQSLFNQHKLDLMNVIEGIKAEHSKFKDVYNASRTPTFETATIETQTDHTGKIPKKSGPKGPRRPKMTVEDSGTDTDFLMTPDNPTRDASYLNLLSRQHDADLNVEGRRYRGALRGSMRDRLETFSDGTPKTPQSGKKND